MGVVRAPPVPHTVAVANLNRTLESPILWNVYCTIHEHVEGIFSEGQARVRTGCITDEQLEKVRILNEKYKNHHIRGLM